MLRRSASILILLVFSALVGAAPQPGQQTPSRPAPGPAAAGTAAGSNALEPTPLHIEALGLTFNPPAGAKVERKDVGRTPTIQLTDPTQPPDWHISIQPLLSTLEAPSPEALAQQHLEELKKVLKPDKEVPVLSSGAVQYGDLNGWLFYVESQSADPENPKQYVTGWLILPTGPRTFLVISSVVMAPQFPALRPVLESSFATIKLESIDQIDSERKTVIDAGKALLATFDPGRLHELIGQDQWFRVYQPSPSGEQEIGVYHLQVTQAKRGALNPDREERRYDPKEEELGLMVSVHTRQVRDSVKNIYVDALFSYWMTWDRSEEQWSQVSTIRQGEHEVSEAQTGVRTSGPKPRLTVIGGQARTAARDETTWPIPDSYLSQAEHWLLGRLMPRDLTEAREFGFYFFNSAKNDVVRRTDRWSPAGADSQGGDAAWILSTAMGSDAKPTVTYFDDKGEFVRQVRPNGSIVVPITPERIRLLWSSKGLKWSSSP